MKRPVEVLGLLARPVKVLGRLDEGPVLAGPVPAAQQSRPQNQIRDPIPLDTLESLESLDTL